MPKKWWPLILSVAICGIVYLPRLNAPLIWDDYGTIVLNKEIEQPIPLKDFLTPKYFEFSKEQSWRPMATLSYYVLLRLKGKTPWVLRSLLLSAHLINGLLLFAFLSSCGIGSEIGLAAASLFLVHAAHTETLMCLSFNEELLVALGLLTMLWAHRRKNLALTAAGYAFAVLSKETGTLGLPLIFLCDIFIPPHPNPLPHRGEGTNSLSLAPLGLPAGQAGRGEGEGKYRWSEYVLLSGIAAGYMWVRFFHLKGPESAGGVSLAIPTMERLYYGLSGFVTAFRVFFFPIWLRIEYFALPPASLLEGSAWIAAGALILCFLAYLFKYFWKKDRVMAYFLLWPFVFLALTSNVVPTQLLNLRYMAERWLYLPYLGASVILAHALLTPHLSLPSNSSSMGPCERSSTLRMVSPMGRGIKENALSQRERAGVREMPWLATALLLFWGTCGYARIQDWSQEPRLWTSLVRIYPWSAKAQEGLGEAYFHRDSYPEALRAFQAAHWLRESRQDMILAHYTRRVISRRVPAERKSSFHAGIPLQQGNPLKWESASLYRWLGRTYLKLGDIKDAEGSSWKAVALEPNDDYTYRLMAYSLAKEKDFTHARQWADQGLRLYPEDNILLRLKSDAVHRRLSFHAGFY